MAAKPFTDVIRGGDIIAVHLLNLKLVIRYYFLAYEINIRKIGYRDNLNSTSNNILTLHLELKTIGA